MSFLSSLSVAGVGMGVVFVGLAIIIGFIYLISLVSRTGAKKSAPKKADAPVVSPAPVAPAVVLDEGISADVIAAITAAVAAVWEGDTGFVVRRVRRAGQMPAWKRAGLEEQIYSRM